ncbi:MAG: class II fumarate hydratase [Gammaproteobacteria bacterium]|nr:class II fumarate hydratase [Gammaproteobacteria bacterium]
MTFRTEEDSLGKVKVPKTALYGAQTQRAIDNFKISGDVFPPDFIESLAALKAACALANHKAKLMPATKAKAISSCALDIHKNIDKYYDQFPIDLYQTGSGTSTNMNMNEVLATTVSKKLKKKVHPNDDINKSQSSNDVIPTTINICSVLLALELNDALDYFTMKLIDKEFEVKDIIKSGRTHLMDAVPLSLSYEIESWREQIVHCNQPLLQSAEELQYLPIGGTAIGTGLNAPKNFGKLVSTELNKILGKTGAKFTSNPNKSEMISSQNHILTMSGALLRVASSLTKISNDLRWMNSGPVSGLSEITLKPLQPGSSIMPGKINPVIPEAVLMAMAQVTGHHSAINIACISGNFQLNTMLPLISKNIIESFNLLINSVYSLADTIDTFKVNKRNIQLNLEKNPIIATKLNETIGYDLASKIVKEAYKTNKSIIDITEEKTNLTRSQILKLLDPKKLI